MYNAALFLHLLGVALLVSSVTITLLALLRIQTAGTVRELRSLIAGTKRVEVVIGPAMLLIIGSGLYMVAQHGDQGSNPWTAGWVITSLVVTVLVAVIGVTVEGSDDRRLRAAIASAEGELPHADLREIQLAPRLTYLVSFGTFQVVALLFLMTNRPGLVVAIAACVIAAVASAIAASIRLRSVRRRARRTSPVGLDA